MLISRPAFWSVFENQHLCEVSSVRLLQTLEINVRESWNKRRSEKHKPRPALYCPPGLLPTLEIKTSINFPLGCCASSRFNCNLHIWGNLVVSDGQHLAVPILWLWKLVPVFSLCSPDLPPVFLLDNAPLTGLNINPMSPHLNFSDVIMDLGKIIGG